MGCERLHNWQDRDIGKISMEGLAGQYCTLVAHFETELQRDVMTLDSCDCEE